MTATAGFVRQNSGLVVVDHGSKEESSNLAFESLVRSEIARADWRAVEPAHMDVAEPSLQTAIGLCLDAGAEAVVVSPFFLLPGRHWQKDIPARVHAALAGTDVPFVVTSPIGLDPAICDVVSQTVDFCLGHVEGRTGPCVACRVSGLPGCRLESPA